MFCCLLLLCFSFICRAQEEEEKEQPQDTFADILTDECGEQPDSLDDYSMPSDFAGVEAIEVTNGNTIVVLLSNKTRKAVRLSGLSVADVKTNEGKQAQQFLSNMVLGKKVFVFQYQKTNADKMEGIIALAGTYTDVNLSMLKSGMARYEKSKQLSEHDNCAYSITANSSKKPQQ